MVIQTSQTPAYVLKYHKYYRLFFNPIGYQVINMTTVFVLLFPLLTTQTGIKSELLKGASEAMSKNQKDKAATIYEALRIIDPDNLTAMSSLASIYLSTNRSDAALDLYRTMVSNHCGDSCKKDCYSKDQCNSFRININRLSIAASGDETVPVSTSIPDLAQKAFKEGLKLKSSKKYKEARDMLTVALKLHPGLIGVYRHLGEIYDNLKDKKQADEFYLWYLRVRPLGENATRVKKKLSKEAKKTLGTIDLSSSYECFVNISGQNLVNARDRMVQTPVKRLELPKGRYGVGFICPKYFIAYRFWVNIEPGKKTKLDFQYGGIAVNLNPWARIYIAPKDGPGKGKFMDAGLFEVIGLRVGSYTLKLVSFDKKKQKIMDITIKPRNILKINKW